MAELAPKEVIASLRRPKVLFTKAYLDTAIKTKTDERFHPETSLRQLNEIAVVDRDGANFALVDVGVSGSVYYPVHMTSPVYDPIGFAEHIDTEFREF